MVDWINISQNSGSGNATITVTATSYSQLLERSTALTVRTATKSAVVGITQRYNSSFTVSPATISAIPYSGANYSITVTANDNWSATTIPSWCSLSVGSGNSGTTTITLTVDSNSGSARTDSLVFSCNGISRTVAVSQVAYEAQVVPITLSPSTISLPSSGGSYAVTVTCSGEWSLTAPSWITLSQSSGSGNTTITITANANTGEDKSGTLYGITLNSSSSVSVMQNGHYVYRVGSLSPSAVTVPFYATSTTIYVTSNVSWYLTASGNYVIIDNGEGMSGNTIPVTVEVLQNNRSITRSSNIVLYSNDNPLSRVELDRITLTQEPYEAPSASTENHIVRMSCSGGVVQVPFTANTVPTISSVDSYNGISAYAFENYVSVVCSGGNSGSTPLYRTFTVTFDYNIFFDIFVCVESCCQDTVSFTSTYDIAETGDTALFRVVNRAGINSLSIDGDSIDPASLGVFAGYDTEMHFTFSTTGQHTVSCTSISPIDFNYNRSYNGSLILPKSRLTSVVVSGAYHLLNYGNYHDPLNFTFHEYLTSVSITSNSAACVSSGISQYPKFDGSITLSAVTMNGYIGGSVDTNAYLNCSAMTRAVLPEYVDTVSTSSFSGSNIQTLYCYGSTPPYIGSGSHIMEGMKYLGEIHAPVGADYAEFRSKFPSGWSLVYDL